MKILKYRYILIGFCITGLLIACRDHQNVTGEHGNGNEDEEVTDNFDGPTYSDDYTSRSSWADRSQWNLANVHDPSVIKD